MNNESLKDFVEDTGANTFSPAAIASKFINHTNKNIFLTGKAGTGKTTFLRHIIQYTHKKAVIVAPTGIAAINAGGVTIHSLFQLPFGSFIPVNQSNKTLNHQFKVTDPASLIRNIQMSGNKRKLLREIELLIIDEVSMLRADMLDAIDIILKHLRRKHNTPFGGVQVLFIGDMLQLPPVVKEEEWSLLKEHYNSIYFFDAQVLKQEKPLYIELEKIYRQQDNTFVLLLNNLRNDTVTEEDITLLNNYYKPEFKPGPNENYITLTTHNYKADKINQEYLLALKNKPYLFESKIEGDFNEYAYPVEKTLTLKKGTQVMFVKNDASGAQRFFNGKIGIVSAISNEHIEVQCAGTNDPIKLETYVWQNIKYVLNPTTNEIEENVVGTFTQYPIKLAWAITVHKSQGLTFDKAIIDIGDAFAPGQVYVALSRLRSLSGLVLTSRINFNRIQKDGTIIEFSKTKTAKDELSILLDKGESDFLKHYLLNSFDFSALHRYISDHVNSYDNDEKKLVKQEYKSWALELKAMLEKIKPHADNFLNQVNTILTNKNPEHLNSRIKAAFDYFSPEFKSFSSYIIKHIEHINSKKKVKTYLSELLDLETLFFEQIKRMHKASVLTSAILNKQEIDKQALTRIMNDQSRTDRINAALMMKEKTGADVSFIGKEKRARKNKEKKPKIDTKNVSFQLFQQGKTMEEIAIERSLAESTIVSHLAFYVATGKLEATRFVNEEKIKQVIAASKAVNTLQLGAVKSVLGDEFSYNDIRFSLAEYISKQEDAKG